MKALKQLCKKIIRNRDLRADEWNDLARNSAERLAKAVIVLSAALEKIIIHYGIESAGITAKDSLSKANEICRGEE